MYLAWEAMTALVPDLFIDTMGHAFTFHVVASLAGVPVGAYVHYPTSSTDVPARVQERQEGITNSDAIANSATLRTGTLLYVYRHSLKGVSLINHAAIIASSSIYTPALRRASFIRAKRYWDKGPCRRHLEA